MIEQAKRKRLLRWLLFTGLITGTIDALMAIIMNYKVPAALIFKFIASGVFGKLAFAPGTEMVIYGVIFHYWIAFAWSVLFFIIYRQILNLVKFRIFFILITGTVIWVVMNLAIVPISQAHPQPMQLIGALKNIAILIFAFGLPVTIMADKFYSTAPGEEQTYEVLKTKSYHKSSV